MNHLETNESASLTIDLNCDLGEGIGNDALIMPYISSANIACGYHAGDDTTMKSTIELALRHGVALGAHPSYLDRENFGRTDLLLSPPEVYDIVTDQVNKLTTIAQTFGTKLHHVKPHGALYNKAATTRSLAAIIALAVKDVDDELMIYGSRALVSEARKIGMRAAHEVFADRAYNADGSLVSRKTPGHFIEDNQKAVDQVIRMVTTGKVMTISGEEIDIIADTVCIHGDGPHAPELAKAIRMSLVAHKINISKQLI
ncbi:MAG: LamB/YcsF family protein [Chitinophagaceae bacterium]|nr:LamB/YcsF family protein [Chitinophagaceae bacterium]MBN8666288.1 LamB/YcsF family protein [Chitinophagales bacterium]